MSATSIYGLVDNETRANVLIGRLRDRGIALEQISVLFPDLNAVPMLIATERTSKTPSAGSVCFASVASSASSASSASARESTPQVGSGSSSIPATGLVSGGVVDGALGWLTGIGLLKVPGVGPLVVSGPLLMALGGLVGMVKLDGMGGALIALGFPDPQAHRYADKLEVGCILLAVHAPDAAAADLIQSIFTLTNVSDVGTAGEGAINGNGVSGNVCATGQD